MKKKTKKKKITFIIKKYKNKHSINLFTKKKNKIKKIKFDSIK